MPSHIRNPDQVPPGQYFIKVIYVDGKETLFHGPCNSTPNCKRFGPSPVLAEVAKALSAFRSANRIPRSSVPECFEDVSLYTCARIGGMSTWCVDSGDPAVAQVNAGAVAPAPCATCGHKLQ